MNIAVGYRVLQRCSRSYAAQPTQFQVREPLRISYLNNTTRTPFIKKTIGRVLEEGALLHGDKELMVYCEPGVRLSPAELLVQADKLAGGLYELGLRPGDRLAVYGANSPKWSITASAAARIGIEVVCVNVAYSPRELLATLNKTKVKLIVADSGIKTLDYYKLLSVICPELPSSVAGQLTSSSIPTLRCVVFMDDTDRPGTLKYNDVLNLGGSRAKRFIASIQDKISPSDVHCILFTSGTTGDPKAIPMTHETGLNASKLAVDRFMVPERKDPHTFCINVQFFHSFGYGSGTFYPSFLGTKMVYPSMLYSPTTCLQAVEDEKCSWIYATPTMLSDLVAVKGKYDVSSLVGMTVGGAPITENNMEKLSAELNLVAGIKGFGLTETCATLLMGHALDPPAVRYRYDGYPMEGVEIKIVDDTGKTCPVNEHGEIYCRGFVVMSGYVDNPRKTSETFTEDGWFKTGDLGCMSDNGYCTITGRLKDLIIRGGTNIYPTDIENLIMENEKVREVHVFGVPDERLGEKVAAAVLLKDGQTCSLAELGQYLQDRVDSKRIPEFVEFVTSFPVTATGKVRKIDLTKSFIEKYDLNQSTV